MSPEDLLGLAHDAVDQLLDGRNVVDQADHQATAPCAGIHLPVDHHIGVDGGDLRVDVRYLQRGAFLD